MDGREELRWLGYSLEGQCRVRGHVANLLADLVARHAVLILELEGRVQQQADGHQRRHDALGQDAAGAVELMN